MLKLNPSYEDVKPYLAKLDWTYTHGVLFCRPDGFYSYMKGCLQCPFYGGFEYNCKFSVDNPHLPHLLTQIRHLHPELFI